MKIRGEKALYINGCIIYSKTVSMAKNGLFIGTFLLDMRLTPCFVGFHSTPLSSNFPTIYAIL